MKVTVGVFVGVLNTYWITSFGRIAAQTARQVVQQRIREAERSNQMQYFERQVGEIVSGIVQATNM